MRLRATDATRYPRLNNYVKNHLPRVVQVSAIVSAFRDVAGLASPALRAALRPNTNPDLHVVPGLWASAGAYGWTPPPGKNGKNPHLIMLDAGLVRRFEAGPEIVYVKYNRRVRKLGVVLLHELIHWATYETGSDGPGEEGNQFERLVYGLRVP